MGREVKRVPIDFNWPTGEIWNGYLRPDSLRLPKCPDCDGRGYSKHAMHLRAMWYGYVPFKPESNGSKPHKKNKKAIRTIAERNITQAPDYYGYGEAAIDREAQRLAALFNQAWMYHVNDDDIAALVEARRLVHFTHTWSPQGRWQPKDPPVVPTPGQVNDWAMLGIGHDGINASVVIKARCDREGIPELCGTCDGHGDIGSTEQRAAHEAWERTDPPAGDGWQLWSTTTEGHPMSPVFATSGELATWMSDPARGDQRVSADTAANFISSGWAPTFVGTPEAGIVSGVEYVGTMEGGPQ